MRVRRGVHVAGGIVLLLAVAAVLPTGGASDTAAPCEVSPEPLDHATYFWSASTVETTGSYAFRYLLGVEDVDQDGFPDLLVAVDRRLQILLGDGTGSFTEGFWRYVNEVKYDDGDELPRRNTERALVPYEIDEHDGVGTFQVERSSRHVRLPAM